MGVSQFKSDSRQGKVRKGNSSARNLRRREGGEEGRERKGKEREMKKKELTIREGGRDNKGREGRGKRLYDFLT